MTRKLLLASAGAGKSQKIAEEALERAASGDRVLLLTYTINNQVELVRHICRLNKFQPPNVTVKGWFSFLLEDMVRPYQCCIVPKRISEINFNDTDPHRYFDKYRKPLRFSGRAELNGKKQNPLHYVTEKDNRAHTHYLAKLASKIHKLTKGKSACRLAEIYDAVFIDEMQDLVGWDFEVIRAIVKTAINKIDCYGDFRQTIYRTSQAEKNPRTSAEKLNEFTSMGFEVESMAISWRCIQSICDLADRLHSNDGHYVPTASNVVTVPPEHAYHQGIFAVPAARIAEYIRTYNPVLLRKDCNTRNDLCECRTVYNFGKSKGLGFERVLIIPTKPHSKFLSGDLSAFDQLKTDESRNKLYVAITRARYSVAFLHEGKGLISGAQVWDPSH